MVEPDYSETSFGELYELSNKVVHGLRARGLKKGDQAYFEGSLQTRSFEDSSGNTRYVTEVKLREITRSWQDRVREILSTQYDDTPFGLSWRWDA